MSAPSPDGPRFIEAGPTGAGRIGVGLRLKNLIQEYFGRTEYLTNVRIVFVGILVAQVFPILVSPVVTRLYGPELFGVIALYKSVESVLSIVITGRYHFAILLPKEDTEAYHLVTISILFAAGFSVLTFLLLWPFGRSIMNALRISGLGGSIYLIPLSTLLVGGFNTLSYWYTRQGDFRSISKGRVLLSLTNEVMSIPLGFSAWKNVGLVASRIFSQFVGVTYFGRKFLSRKSTIPGSLSKSGLLGSIKKYRDFPIQSGAAGILNNVSAEVPFFFISSFYGLQVLGWFALSSRIISVPVQLIGSAFSDVFYKKAMEAGSRTELKKLMSKTVSLLLLPTILLFILVMAFGKWLMAPVFGEKWVPAGPITCALSFLLAARLMYTSLNAVIFVERRNDYDVKWNAANLAIMILSLALGYGLFRSYFLSILFYSISSAGVYVFNTFWLFRIVGKPESSVKPGG